MTSVELFLFSRRWLCVSCELVCVCVSLERVVVICPASTHTALVSSPSLSDCSSPSYIGYTHIPSLIPTCSYFFLHSAMGMMVVSASTTVLADSIALG